MHPTPAKLVALLAVTAQWSGVAAGPIEKRDDSTFSGTSTAPTAAPVETISTEIVSRPTITGVAPTLSPNASSSLAPSGDFPICDFSIAKPFCLPTNNSEVYVGERYYVTWNPHYFKPNSTVNILLNWFNDTNRNVWASGPMQSKFGVTAIDMKQEWLQGYTAYNLTFFAQHLDAAAGTTAIVYDGPTVELQAKPSRHLEPQEAPKSAREMGLKVGVPVCLGFAVLVVVGLAFGMRKHRRIGLGNVMGRKRGYGSRKARWQRLGRGKASKKDDLLQEHELLRSGEYQDDPLAQRKLSSDSSLDTAVERPSDDRNAFREEMERQKTGSRQ
ncbi:uncharacterized protein LTHEOB_6138 [Lasiodiplodia theobromae]|uniref:Uncharacterized protein n=1 Tax=Lasiodiplodia theobromae TaxID=45133 RepID=A0A5N5D5T9_9PEZI|nr:uncharacterized protein LTHEOB_6138 [Lasiodiplodia theobromae]KAB2573126.1 hypothetical protein DBV05_g8175 [Lasiodiplodia theobromae]KAF4544568.1 hypothetical protein LTHEOB_6138 [Lasiodiplodia theobromae]